MELYLKKQKQKLVETIATYTEENLQAIEYYRNSADAEFNGHRFNK